MEGDTEELGEALPLGETEGDSLADGDTLTLGEILGDSLDEGERLAEGLTEALALLLGEALALGESEGETEGEMELEGLTTTSAKARCARCEPLVVIRPPSMTRRIPEPIVIVPGTLLVGQLAAVQMFPAASPKLPAAATTGPRVSRVVASSLSSILVREEKDALPSASRIM